MTVNQVASKLPTKMESEGTLQEPTTVPRLLQFSI